MLFVAIPVAALGLCAWSSYQVWTQSHRDEMHAADAIVVLGAAQYDGRPSPILQARLDHALYLYREGMAPLIVTTGGKLAGDEFTESGTGQRYLISHGVSQPHLLGENKGHTTFESLRNVASLASFHNVHRVLLVSDPLHSARIKQMALDLGFQDAYTSPAGYQELSWSTNTKLQEFTKETASLTLYRIGFDR
jgi:uncharacterized SAM-binding protein YcdF (DUF218 family)